MNPFCEIAVEEALKMREGGHASEIVAVSVGRKEQEVCHRNLMNYEIYELL
jgi:electron transfer flavoprotein beta subunit